MLKNETMKNFTNFKKVVIGLLFISTTSLANYSFAACNVNDVPLGSGNVSSGTSIVKVVENQNANGSGGQDGDFSLSLIHI